LGRGRRGGREPKRASVPTQDAARPLAGLCTSGIVRLHARMPGGAPWGLGARRGQARAKAADPHSSPASVCPRPDPSQGDWYAVIHRVCCVCDGRPVARPAAWQGASAGLGRPARARARVEQASQTGPRPWHLRQLLITRDVWGKVDRGRGERRQPILTAQSNRPSTAARKNVDSSPARRAPPLTTRYPWPQRQ